MVLRELQRVNNVCIALLPLAMSSVNRNRCHWLCSVSQQILKGFFLSLKTLDRVKRSIPRPCKGKVNASDCSSARNRSAWDARLLGFSQSSHMWA